VGSTDAAIAMATGTCWFRIPQTIRININGTLPKGVFAKDVILSIAKQFKSEGGNYRVFEYGGEVVRKFDVPSRLTLTNMSAEMGVKAAIVEPDNQTITYLKQQNRNITFNPKDFQSDTDCVYEKIININISKLIPQIAQPPDIDNVTDVSKLENKKIKVDQIFIGSCTNCRIEDLDIVYKIWENKKLNSDVRTIITPASKLVFLQALKKGYIEFFTKIGATVSAPGCGPCLGRHGGVLFDNEVCVSTSNRNFTGRMGSAKSFIYLASPATAAATAVNGYISDPRNFL
ncbi:MAG: aconitase family protein, partial [bacterium]|nr:aconitase family protein [bacterium]